ncbi:hypothetical protein BGX26_001099 [Mortierella sp. AD094]|nr:hypothetical protein BGX26_001099 [Mortierella sp. AD094]
MTANEPFDQNQEAAKRVKISGQKRKQPGTQNTLLQNENIDNGIPFSNTHNNGLYIQNGVAATSGLGMQQVNNLQHQQLNQYLPLAQQPNFNGSPLVGSNNVSPYSVNARAQESFVNGHSYPGGLVGAHTTNGPIGNGFSDTSSIHANGHNNNNNNLTVPGSIPPPKSTTPEEMDALVSMLSETTLNGMAYYGPSAAASDYNDDDLWGPQIRSSSSVDQVVPPELQILPDPATRQQLTELYYKNHFFLLPMVQRQVLRVCEENIHIPHCLLLCNAVYYCGSMYSENTVPLRTDSEDESTVGEDFFIRGQTLMDKKYLTSHICTIQALLLFAIGHKSPAQRSGFISQAITMTLDMGLHTKLDDSVNCIVRAYRARVFWCCFIFDSSSSAIGGKPTLINDEEITVDMVQAGDLGPETENYSDQYIVHCIRGWQICRRIRKNSKLVSRRPMVSEQILLENLDRLDKELVEWQEQLPPVFDLVPTKGSITSDIRSLAAVAQLLCYALIILLHHPYLPNPKSPEAFLPPRVGGPPDSQGYCTQAAKEITKIAGILLKEAPRTFERNTPSRYALNFAIRIHLRNAKCTVDVNLAKDSRRDLQKSMDYVEQVENMQFFRINRAKKSDVGDLLASCRAALAQQKSSVDLAKEAAAVKHRQLLHAKLVAKEQLRQQQLQQQQQQGQLNQLPQVNSPPQQSLSPQLQGQQLLLMQQQQQQQQQQLHQQRLQQIAHENILRQNYLQQQQQQLQILRQQHQQQLQQQQQQQHAQSGITFQNSVLFQGQPDFGGHAVGSNQLTSQNSAQSATTIDRQHQQQASNWQPGNGSNNGSAQDTLALNSNVQDFMSNGNFLTGPQVGGSTEEIFDIRSITFDPRQEALFSTAASSGYNNFVSGQPLNTNSSPFLPPPTTSPIPATQRIVDDVFLTSIPRSQVALPSPANPMASSAAQNQRSPSLLDESSMSPTLLASVSASAGSPLFQAMKLHQQNQQPFHLGGDNNGIGNSNSNNSGINNNNGNMSVYSPELASSVVSSPGGSTLSEESILQSLTGQMMNDTYYMHINLPAEHPRNDPTSFEYLPSALEYGDTAAVSPAASGSSSEMDALSPPPF